MYSHDDRKNMRAVVYKENGRIEVEERQIPALQDERDAIIRVTLTTICSSDIHIKHGAVPRAVPGVILGHEFVGEVVETGANVTTVKPGDRVAVNVETFCGECFYCKKDSSITVPTRTAAGLLAVGLTEDRQNMSGFLLLTTDLQRY